MTIDEYRQFLEEVKRLRLAIRAMIQDLVEPYDGESTSQLRLCAMEAAIQLEGERAAILVLMLGLERKTGAAFYELSKTPEGQKLEAEILAPEPEWDLKVKLLKERLTKEAEADMGAFPMVENTGALPVEEALGKFDEQSESRAMEALGAAFDQMAGETK